MSSKMIVWLLFATFLNSQAAFAEHPLSVENSSASVGIERTDDASIHPASEMGKEKREEKKRKEGRRIIGGGKERKKEKGLEVGDSQGVQKNAAFASNVPNGFTLKEAIRKALAASPRVEAVRSGLAMAQGEARQAQVWSNPEVSVEAENVAGKGAYRGVDSAEVTYGITQEVQIGGKISAREKIANEGIALASLDVQASALDLIRDVTIAYADTVAAEEQVRLATEQKALAEDVLKSVSVRVGTAAAPLIQKSRAEVERASAAIALDKSTRERDIAQKKLAVLMGDENFRLPLDRTTFFAIASPENNSGSEKLRANPDIAKLERNREQSQARLDLEKATAIPDPRVNIGVRDFRENGEQAFIVGVSVPLPVFNANRGNIAKAHSEVSRVTLDNRQTLLNFEAELTQASERMQNAYLQAETLKNDVLPSADKAFRLAREGYNLGRFPYLEVLDAQRSLFGVKQQQIEALREFHSTKAQVGRLTAAHLNDVNDVGGSHEE